MSNKKITTKSNVRVNWSDKFENYSKEKEREIIKYIKNKYKTTGNVRVDFTPTNKLNMGVTNLENGDVENINTPEVQERIILEWLKDNHIDITLDDIRRLNRRVEANLVDFNDTKDTRWKIKKLTLENFLSYGDETVFDFDKLRGLTLIQGENFSGKTTVLEGLIFLLFNTTTKTTVVDEVINMYNDAKFAKVTGELIIDSIEYKIERVVKRVFKKDGTYQKTVTELKFMTKNGLGEYEELDKEEDRKATDKKIKESIGSYKEFMMTVVCTGDTIFDIIKAKATERGQLLSRFMGLEIFEKKEATAKLLYSDWKSKSKIDKYSSSDLQVSIDENQVKIEDNNNLIKDYKKDLGLILETKKRYLSEKQSLALQYHNDIDSGMINLSEKHYIDKIDVIKNDIITKTEILEATKLTYKDEVEVFDEKSYDANLEKIRLLEINLNSISDNIKSENNKITDIKFEIKDIEGNNKVIENELTNLRSSIHQMKNGVNCSECGQVLANVDHKSIIKTKTEEGVNKAAIVKANNLLIAEKQIKIETHTKNINDLNEKLVTEKENIKVYEEENKVLSKAKEKITENDIIGLKIDKYTVELEMLVTKQLREEENLRKFKTDLSKIQKNKELDELIRLKTIEVTGEEEKERNKNREMNSCESTNTFLLKQNEENELLIDTIKKEEHINKVFLVYLNMVGKNGISKTIMKNSIPVLNHELSKFMRDSAEFTVEIEINIKNNEVEFWLIDNETGSKANIISGSGYEKTIAALAIRVVNSKINALPKASLLLVDEVFSTVSVTNMELIKIFMDKVSLIIDNVFMITHNELVKEWADNIITVTKENKISKALF